MRKVFIVQHVEAEGAGTLNCYLEQFGAPYETIRLHAGEPFPENLGEVRAVISMGGPMNVYEEEKFPFLKSETDFLRRAAAKDIPVLGICLGSQMAAKALGARVERSPVEEIGWFEVRLTPEGRAAPLFAGLPEKMEIFQWHGDMFGVPEGGELIAAGDGCPRQAFRRGRAYGLQFHFEITREMIARWARKRPDREALLARYDELRPVVMGYAETICRNFLDIAGE